MRHRLAFAFLVLTSGTPLVLVASAQGPVERQFAPPPTQQVLVDSTDTPTTDEAAPISPKVSPGPMSLDACIELGFKHQPALDAARASLGAAQSGQQGVSRLIIPRLLSPDLKYRRQQACQGVTIAGAALTQAELETRYAVTRNFFTVQYIRSQQIVIADVLRSLDEGYKKAKKIYDAGDANAKVTKLDLDAIQVQMGMIRGRKAQADNGMLKAFAALREAMGLNYDYPLEIAKVDLPTAVYEVKTQEGKDVKIEYRPVYAPNKAELIAAALANRPELTQASAASIVTDLEIAAQDSSRGWRKPTWASAADPHVQPIPQGLMNGEYRPGAFALEAPPNLVGRKADRVQRARDLHQRAMAVVDKAQNLVSLDVEVQYLKWQEAVEDIAALREIYDTAQKLPDQVLKLVQGKDLTSTQIIQSNVTAIMVRTQLNDEMHVHALALAGLERSTAGAFKIFPVPAASK